MTHRRRINKLRAQRALRRADWRGAPHSRATFRQLIELTMAEALWTTNLPVRWSVR